MDQQLTEQQKRQQKFFLVLPIIAIPILTLFFWAMGGGKTSQTMARDHQSGLNLLLPDAKKGTVSGNDKNASYELARQDSLKRLEAARQDPYYLSYGPNPDTTAAAGLRLLDNKQSFSQFGYTDPNEQKVYNRLSELSTVLQQNKEVSSSYNSSRGYSQKDEEISSLKEDINRLQSMMMEMGSNKTNHDPEMDQINNVLENVLDIQHPARVQQRLKEKSSQNLGQVYGVGSAKTAVPYTLLDNKSVKDYANEYATEPHKEDNRFFGLTNERGDADDQANSISAVVHENQTLISGATVKLRLTEDVYINGIRIPKNEFIYGQAQLTGERLTIEIESIRYKNSLLPVALSVYDLDGQAGIRIPGTITRDVVKQNSNEAISSLSLGSFDQSIGAQAASAGIELGKNLFSKKIKLVKVEVKAGYKILLKDNKNKQNSSF